MLLWHLEKLTRTVQFVDVQLYNFLIEYNSILFHFTVVIVPVQNNIKKTIGKTIVCDQYSVGLHQYWLLAVSQL